jgi:hypothetical protein
MSFTSICVTTYKAIELDSASRQRTGRETPLAATTRQAAVDELLALLQVSRDAARVDPSRTLVQVGTQLWTIVGFAPQAAAESPSLRRAGAKHKRVR